MTELIFLRSSLADSVPPSKPTKDPNRPGDSRPNPRPPRKAPQGEVVQGT